MTMETLILYDRNAEKSLLGACLRDNGCLDDVAPSLRQDDFYVYGHQVIYKAMLDCGEANMPPDAITLANQLRKNQQLDDAGGPFYLVELWDAAPCAGNVKHYGQIIGSLAHKRRQLQALDRCREKILDPSVTSDEAQENTEREILSLSEMGNIGKTTPMASALRGAMVRLNERLELQRQGKSYGVQTGFVSLDQMTRGFQPGELIIIAARTSIGKTALAINIAANVATAGVAVFFVSLEQSHLELIERIWCRQESIDSSCMRHARFVGPELANIIQGNHDRSRWPMEWDDMRGQTVLGIAAKARRLKRQNRLGIVFIDYLQLIDPENPKAQRPEQVASITRRLKVLAHDLAVPVVALSQLNRESDKRNEAPRLSDLRESGAIEQDADGVLLLHREHEDDGTSREKETIIVNLAKRRNGPTGEFRMTFARNHCAFEDWTPGAPAP
jgi:replicative DNA helicase